MPLREVSKLTKEKNSTINEELNTEMNDQVELTEEETAETVFAEEEESKKMAKSLTMKIIQQRFNSLSIS